MFKKITIEDLKRGGIFERCQHKSIMSQGHGRSQCGSCRMFFTSAITKLLLSRSKSL